MRKKYLQELQRSNANSPKQSSSIRKYLNSAKNSLYSNDFMSKDSQKLFKQKSEKLLTEDFQFLGDSDQRFYIKSSDFTQKDLFRSTSQSKFDKEINIEKLFINDGDCANIWTSDEEDFYKQSAQTKPSIKLRKNQKSQSKQNFNFMSFNSPTETTMHIPKKLAKVLGGYQRNPNQLKIQEISSPANQQEMKQLNENKLNLQPFVIRQSPANLFESEDMIERIRIEDLYKKPNDFLKIKPYEYQ